MNNDSCQQAVYDAEDIWLMESYILDTIDPDQDTIDPSDIRAFITKTLSDAGWHATNLPTVALDVPDDDHRAGWVSGTDQTIHLHPRLLRRPLILHEVAHWLDARDGHGPIFQGNLVTLYDAAFGPEAASLLYDCFAEKRLTPDPWRLPDSMPTTKRLQAASLTRSKGTCIEQDDR